MIDGRSRVELGHWPTPLERCDGLTAALGGGTSIWVKRDDCTGLAIGGNKTRKLEYLLAQALAEGHDTVVTFGAVQSNHARQTAAACARLGLRCELLLNRTVRRPDELYETSGNVLLDELLGANVRFVDGLDDTVAALEEIGPAFHIPPGGSNAVGVLGYVRAAAELAAQLAGPAAAAAPTDVAAPASPARSERGPGHVDRIVLACSSAGTAAGLVLGLARAGLRTRVEVICVYAPPQATREKLEVLVTEGAGLLGMGLPDETAPAREAQASGAPQAAGEPGPAGAPVEDLVYGTVRARVHGRWLGPGYGVPTAEMTEAVRLFARTEGLLLDPVYSGKAAAGLAGLVRGGEIGPDETVVFWHTGGTPGLFVYPDAL